MHTSANIGNPGQEEGRARKELKQLRLRGHERNLSPFAFTSAAKRFGKLEHNPSTSQVAFTSRTAARNLLASCFGVSAQGVFNMAADLSTLARNHEIAVSCRSTSAISGGCAWGPEVALVPAQSP